MQIDNLRSFIAPLPTPRWATRCSRPPEPSITSSC